MLIAFVIAYLVIAFVLLAVMRHNEDEERYEFSSDAVVALLWLPFVLWLMAVVWSDAHRRSAA